MTDFGYHPGTNPTTFDDPSNNVIWAKATATPSTGTLTSISLFCKILAGSPTFKVALYADSAGAPGSKIADSGATTGTPSSTAGYVTVACSASLTSGTQYWFAVLVPGGGGTADINMGFDTNGSATEGYFLGNGVPGASTFPGSGAGATSFANERFAIYGTYTLAGSVQQRLFGYQWAVRRAANW